MVRRGKWLILLSAVIIPVAAFAYSSREKPVYQASATVLLSTQSLAAALTGTQNQLDTPDRIAATQAELARVPEVVNSVIGRFHLPMTAGAFLSQSSVTAQVGADILVFTVTSGDPALVPKLASAYAHAYTAYRLRLDTASLEAARAEVQAQLDELRRAHQASSSLYSSLFSKEQELRTLEALQTSNAFVVNSPSRASKIVAPMKRDIVVGLVLGILLGIGLAYLREVLDTRVRSEHEVTERLGLPLLGRLAAPPRELAARNELVTVAEPSGVYAEAFRMVRNNLEIVSVDQSVRSLLVTSALEGEGKTTTASNLAVTLARGGKRVALVDLDFRRAAVSRFFDLATGSGLTQVVVGHTTVENAPVRISFVSSSANGREPTAESAVTWSAMGSLDVFGAGPLPPDPGEFVRTKSLHDVLAKIAERYEVVVMDAPPLLHFGDVIVLGGLADGIVLVTRLDLVRRPMLNEVKTLLEPVPTSKLGVIIAGAETDSSYGYGYGAKAYGYQEAADAPESARSI